MNRGERIAEENICNACKYFVEGYYEKFKEENFSLLPSSIKDLENVIYISASNNLYFSSGDGCQLGVAPKEMKLVSKDFCRKVIYSYLRVNENFKEIIDYKKWVIPKEEFNYE